MTYAEQLKHPKWQKRRLEILSRAGFKCESCDADDKTLHVHHKRYRKGAMAWEYADDQLEALCEECHQAEHLVRSELEDVISRLPSYDVARLLGYAKSFLVNSLWDADETGDSATSTSIRVGSAEEAEGLGDGLGLDSAESQYILAKSRAFLLSELLEIGKNAVVRNVRGRREHTAHSAEELASIADSLPSRSGKL